MNPCPHSLGRIRSEGATGAAQRYVRDRIYVGLEGDALLCRRALEGAPVELRELGVAHYVAVGFTTRERASVLGLSEGRYFATLAALRWYVAGALAAFDRRRVEVAA